MNKTYGLLMSGEMVRAYKDKLKSETRRTRGLDIVNKAPDEFKFIGFDQNKPYAIFEHRLGGTFNYRMPYGRVGDTLWFKETWKMCERDGDGKDFLHYRADDEKVDPDWWTKEDWTRPDPVWVGRFDNWQPSMFMPKLCCRFKDIPVLDVLVERLNDISNVDAIFEGCPMDVQEAKTPRQWYFELWDKLNGDKLPAKINPWVWVYRFPKYEGVKA